VSPVPAHHIHLICTTAGTACPLRAFHDTGLIWQLPQFQAVASIATVASMPGQQDQLHLTGQKEDGGIEF